MALKSRFPTEGWDSLMIMVDPLAWVETKQSPFCRHFADKLFNTSWHRVALPDKKVALRQGETAHIAIWRDGVARYASYF